MSVNQSSHRHLVVAIKIGLAFILFTPLVLLQNFYFPFIVPRNLFFRLLVDIIFALYLYLSIVDINYRPKFNKGFILFFLFTISLTISSILGGHFTYSFWSNFERMDGLVNWLHIVLYAIILLGIFRTKQQWYTFFKISLFSALISTFVAFGQKFGWSFIMSSAGGQRLTALMGNAAYVASYLMLHSFLAIYLLKIEWAKLFWRYFYFFSLFSFIYILINTETRGAFLGLLVFAILFALGYLWAQRKNRNKMYYGVLILLISIFIFITLLFVQKQANWVKNVSLFNKIANISLNDTTTQSRLTIWRNSLEGVKEKPIFGWGEENFIYVFNKYFPVEIFHDIGSEVWFDRPHNILVQHLVQGGLLGLLLYLSIFFYLIYLLYKKYLQDKNEWFFSFFWAAFLVSFLLHDLFIFDSVNTNIILYLILAFLWQENSNISLDKFFDIFKKYKYFFALSISTIFLILSFYFFYLAPLASNLSLIKFLSYSYGARNVQDLSTALDFWDKSFEQSFLGKKEKGENLQKVSLNLLQNPNIDSEIKQKFFNKTESVLEFLIHEYPDDIRMTLFLVNFYESMQVYRPEFIERNLQLLNNLHNLAPQRPETLLKLSDIYLVKGDNEMAMENAQKLLTLFPWAKVVHWHYFRVALVQNDHTAMDRALTKIVELNQQKEGINFLENELKQLDNLLASLTKDQNDLKQLINKYLNN